MGKSALLESLLKGDFMEAKTSIPYNKMDTVIYDIMSLFYTTLDNSSYQFSKITSQPTCKIFSLESLARDIQKIVLQTLQTKKREQFTLYIIKLLGKFNFKHLEFQFDNIKSYLENRTKIQAFDEKITKFIIWEDIRKFMGKMFKRIVKCLPETYIKNTPSAFLLHSVFLNKCFSFFIKTATNIKELGENLNCLKHLKLQLFTSYGKDSPISKLLSFWMVDEFYYTILLKIHKEVEGSCDWSGEVFEHEEQIKSFMEKIKEEHRTPQDITPQVIVLSTDNLSYVPPEKSDTQKKRRQQQKEQKPSCVSIVPGGKGIVKAAKKKPPTPSVIIYPGTPSDLLMKKFFSEQHNDDNVSEISQVFLQNNIKLAPKVDKLHAYHKETMKVIYLITWMFSEMKFLVSKEDIVDYKKRNQKESLNEEDGEGGTDRLRDTVDQDVVGSGDIICLQESVDAKWLEFFDSLFFSTKNDPVVFKKTLRKNLGGHLSLMLSDLECNSEIRNGFKNVQNECAFMMEIQFLFSSPGLKNKMLMGLRKFIAKFYQPSSNKKIILNICDSENRLPLVQRTLRVKIAYHLLSLLLIKTWMKEKDVVMNVKNEFPKTYPFFKLLSSPEKFLEICEYFPFEIPPETLESVKNFVASSSSNMNSGGSNSTSREPEMTVSLYESCLENKIGEGELTGIFFSSHFRNNREALILQELLIQDLDLILNSESFEISKYHERKEKRMQKISDKLFQSGSFDYGELHIGEDTDIPIFNLLTTKLFRIEKNSFTTALFVKRMNKKKSTKGKKTGFDNRQHHSAYYIDINLLYVKLVELFSNKGCLTVEEGNFLSPCETFACLMLACESDYVDKLRSISHEQMINIFREYYPILGDCFSYVPEAKDTECLVSLSKKVMKYYSRLAYIKRKSTTKEFEKLFKTSFARMNSAGAKGNRESFIKNLRSLWKSFDENYKNKKDHINSKEFIEIQILNIEWQFDYYLRAAMGSEPLCGKNHGWQLINENAEWTPGNVTKGIKRDFDLSRSNEITLHQPSLSEFFDNNQPLQKKTKISPNKKKKSQRVTMIDTQKEELERKN